MGLDMYLEKRVYVKNWDHMKPEERTEFKITRNGKPLASINPEKICDIVEEAGYWRKSNQIHKWFVDNVQKGVDDCGYYYVSEGKLQELLKVVTTLLVSRDEDEAMKLLPPQEGFFFGSEEIDKWYWLDLEETKKILEEALNNNDGEFYYHSSW